MDVLVRFLNVLGVKHAIDDGLEMAGLDALHDACQLLVHDGLVGPGAHVNAKHCTVSRHQSKGVKFGCSPQGKEGLEQGALARWGCR